MSNNGCFVLVHSMDRTPSKDLTIHCFSLNFNTCFQNAMDGVFTLSVTFECLGVVVFYLRTRNLLINVLLNHPNILTFIILALFINQSMCAKRKNFH